jgi:hypothetical protein
LPLRIVYGLALGIDEVAVSPCVTPEDLFRIDCRANSPAGDCTHSRTCKRVTANRPSGYAAKNCACRCTSDRSIGSVVASTRTSDTSGADQRGGNGEVQI